MKAKMSEELTEHYQTLELDLGASIEEARKARSVLLRAWHPDRFVNDPEMQGHSEKKTQQINAADCHFYLTYVLPKAPIDGPHLRRLTHSHRVPTGL